MPQRAQAFLSRYRLPLMLVGVVGVFGVVLPACMPSDQIGTVLTVQPSTTPIIYGGQTFGLSATIEISPGNPVGGTITYSRDPQFAAEFSVDTATGLVTAATVQSVAEVNRTVEVSGVPGSDYRYPTPVSKQVTIRTRVTSIAITGGGTLALGSATQLTATPTIVAGSPTTPAPVMMWSSSNSSAVAVSNSGVVTVLQAVAGPVTITAMSEGRVGTTDITVNAGNPLTITTSTLVAASAGGAYAASLAASGGLPGGVLTWDLASGSLPAGITLGSNGNLVSSGVTAAVGTYNFTVRVTSTLGVANVTATKALSIEVTAAPLIVTISPPSRMVNIGGLAIFTMSQTDAAGNPVGTPPAVTWSLSSPTNAVVQATPGHYIGEVTGGTLVRATTAGGTVYTAALTVGARGAVRASATLGTLAGAAADGALLEALNGVGTVVATGVINANRIGVIPGLPAGTYSVRISRAGYITQTIANVVVTANVETDMGSIILIPQ